MILLKRWALLLSAPVLMLSACRSDSSSSTSLVGDWQTRFSFNGVARSEAVCFTIGTKAYLGLGYDGIRRWNDFWEYDITTGLWRQVKSFPGVPRSSAVGFSTSNGKGYVGTGIDDNLVLHNDFYEYTPGTSLTDSGSWVQKSNFGGTPRQDATAFGIGAYGYVISGYDGNYQKDFWQYDPSSDTWTVEAFPGNKRMEATAFVINNKAYFCTGINNGVNVYDFWVYDPTYTTGNGWTQLRDISNTSTDSYDDGYTSITRANGVSFVINGKGYISTGDVNNSNTWEYDVTTDLWTQKTTFEGAARTGAVAFFLNNRGFVATGRNGNTPLDDFWEFLPNNAEILNN